MKLFGHPVHSMLIHFPAALLPMEMALSFLYYNTGKETFGSAAFYCLVAGVLGGIAAIITGAADLLLIPKSQKAAIGNGLVHGVTNATVVMVYAVLAYRAWQQYPQLAPPGLDMLIIKSVLILALLAGNYLGGKLVFQHHLGINSKTSGL